MMKICVLVFILMICMPFALSESPPALPMEIWGQATENGNPVADGRNVTALINGINYAQPSATQAGYYDVIITNLDRPLTYNNDPTCATHWAGQEACAPCTVCSGANCVLGYNASTCIEGPTDNSQVTLKIGNNTVNQTFFIQNGSINNNDVIILTIIVFTKDLVAGWNMFSIPIQPNTTNLTQILSSMAGKYDIVWTTNAGVWQSTKNFFSPLVTITPDKSYQIYMNTAGKLNISGTMINSTTITVVTGWNLIGYPSLDIRNINATLAGKNYSIVWTTNAGVWQSTKNFFNPLVNFTAGNGYRIYANQPFSYTITN
jgi:hypothetical protein